MKQLFTAACFLFLALLAGPPALAGHQGLALPSPSAWDAQWPQDGLQEVLVSNWGSAAHVNLFTAAEATQTREAGKRKPDKDRGQGTAQIAPGDPFGHPQYHLLL